jgi:hypothetical protein
MVEIFLLPLLLILALCGIYNDLKQEKKDGNRSS